MLDTAREQQVIGAIRGKAREFGITIHALGCVEDHIHVVASVPPNLAVAQRVGQMKGASSHYVNQMAASENTFRWQDGYGAVSVGESGLRTIMEYVQN